ncbi:MAG: hypothetical protein JSS27_00170 [Planctomycetes bacterium]|nr:hypothetical protein [Planctomycetota bacterium]
MLFRVARPALLFSAALAVLAGASTAQAQWGDLKIKFKYKGAAPAPVKINVNKDIEVCGPHNLVEEDLVVGADGGVANIIVYLRTKGVMVHPDYAKTDNDKLEYDNKGCRFVPHILPIRLSQSLVLHNSDPVGHNSNLQPMLDAGINPLIPSNQSVEHKFARVQTVPVKITCNIHPWMVGWVLPRDNPYMAVSAADGTLTIEKLPAGELEFQAWHEKKGYLKAGSWANGRFKQTIKDGANDLGVIELDPSLF